ncbi:MAG: hypothetical protein HC771_04810 [Synechococcales cyanobacterium CRU_2_2]|nr:hypothetical protein [Synechococcales cyanobacterium CRU_2_2]
MSNRGVVYAVTQSDVYLEAALMSALALRSLEPSLPITIVADHPQLTTLALERHQITPLFLGELPLSSAFASRWLKTNLNRVSPYTETLFLDADILPLQPVTPLWDYLADRDWAMAADRLPTVEMCDHVAVEEKTYTLMRSPPNTLQFNSGVLLWRDNPATQTLFEQWYAEWQVFQQQDQLALVRALQTTGLPVATLPKTYNISPLDATPLLQAGETVHLLHCWGGQVASGEFRRLMAQYYPEVMVDLGQLRGVSVMQNRP